MTIDRASRSGSGVVALALLALGAACGACRPPEPPPPVGWTTGPDSTGRHVIRDETGRTVILRGVNLGNSSKLPPFVPIWLDGPPNPAFRQMREWGIHVVRLLVIWEAIEPNPGEYDAAYLDIVRKMVDLAAEQGLDVVLDMHQDLFSRHLCGDGAPRWVVRDTLVQQINCSGQWQLLGISEPVTNAWIDFWANKGKQDSLIGSWRAVARDFKDHPAVKGYDILNEPSVGYKIIGDPDLELKYLKPFYERAIAVLREEDPDALIIFEPMTNADYGVSTRLQKLEVANLVYAPHYYNWTLFVGGAKVYRRDQDGTAQFLVDSDRLGRDHFQAPVVIGEYGMRTDVQGYEAYVAHQMVELDNRMMGSFYWNYFSTGTDWQREDMSLVTHDGKNPLQDGAEAPGNRKPRCMVEYVVRPYPRRVAGELLAFKFDLSFQNYDRFPYDYIGTNETDKILNTRVFTMTVLETGVAGDTEIYVPREIHFGDPTLASPPKIEVSDGTTSWTQADPRILVWKTDPAVATHTLKITPNGTVPEPGKAIPNCDAPSPP